VAQKCVTTKNHHSIVLQTASEAIFFINLEYKMSTKYVCIKYMYYTLYLIVTSSVTVTRYV